MNDMIKTVCTYKLLCRRNGMIAYSVGIHCIMIMRVLGKIYWRDEGLGDNHYGIEKYYFREF